MLGDKATVHIVIHRCGQDDRKRAATYRRRLRDLRAEENPERSSTQLVDLPSSLRCRASFRSKTTLAEANSFPCGCQPFCCIPIGLFRLRWAACCLRPFRRRGPGLPNECFPQRLRAPLGQAKFDAAKARQYPRTVARKSAIRLRPVNVFLGTAPASNKTHLRPSHSASPSGRMAMRDTTRRTSWPRASGPSSRITGAEPACMASACGCAPVPGVSSCPTGAVRVAAPCLPDRNVGSFGGASRTQPHEAVIGV